MPGDRDPQCESSHNLNSNAEGKAATAKRSTPASPPAASAQPKLLHLLGPSAGADNSSSPPAQRCRLEDSVDTVLGDVEGGLSTTPLELPRYNYTRDAIPQTRTTNALNSVLTHIINHIEQVLANERTQAAARNGGANPTGNNANRNQTCQCRHAINSPLGRVAAPPPNRPIVISRVNNRQTPQAEQNNGASQSEVPPAPPPSSTDSSHGSICWGHIAESTTDAHAENPELRRTSISRENRNDPRGQHAEHQPNEPDADSAQPTEQILIIIELSDNSMSQFTGVLPPGQGDSAGTEALSTNANLLTNVSAAPGDSANPSASQQTTGPRIVSFLDPLEPQRRDAPSSLDVEVSEQSHLRRTPRRHSRTSRSRNDMRCRESEMTLHRREARSRSERIRQDRGGGVSREGRSERSRSSQRSRTPQRRNHSRRRRRRRNT